MWRVKCSTQYRNFFHSVLLFVKYSVIPGFVLQSIHFNNPGIFHVLCLGEPVEPLTRQGYN